jgi:hypothetical protein
MSETIEAPVIRFRRMELSDIQEMAWLTPRLQTCFPGASPAAIKSLLVQAHTAADQWCGRTDRAAAVAYIEPGILGMPPLIRTIFAFGEAGEDDSLEVAELYGQIVLWAKRMNALGVELAPWSDADRRDVNARLAPPRTADNKFPRSVLQKGERLFWMRGD